MKTINISVFKFARYGLIAAVIAINFWFSSTPGLFYKYHKPYLAVVASVLIVYYFEKFIYQFLFNENTAKEKPLQTKVLMLAFYLINILAILWTFLYPLPKLIERLI
ncbi:MAG: hypothetical protein KBB37_01435 [Bacteroidia bacterium]|nr:hypothetical protein [Bacteroidia bacterium]MBP7259922.1 hypothetical protein [Bacteroidia bacterium]MBP9725629.1 hypothetical protein [Bacteroidia bacterium]